MEDFEKLGLFYLGREYDLGKKARRDRLVLYDSKDLVTHAVCIGMTGSGKTGLCLSLLEEALIDGIPAIAIDPKGDLANLLLTFPDLRPEDFQLRVDGNRGRSRTRSTSVSKRAAPPVPRLTPRPLQLRTGGASARSSSWWTTSTCRAAACTARRGRSRRSRRAGSPRRRWSGCTSRATPRPFASPATAPRSMRR